ncbi:dipeptidase [Algoriphagus sediminis]|uniref:Membrane dipeptidase n=1 Tax=Algoriphagus sediminis TaxID=3057113 RepID=A0ABT7YCN4_9BACT|nr:membrane dipeptidase [Algoriphagus sediminis]MDN3204271.1 membrane dipeptidase [Algoriphagus sediminis]
MPLPIFDMHCDLLSYLDKFPEASPYDASEYLPCAVPYLKKGNVKTQVCAIYTGVSPESMNSALNQAKIFSELPSKYPNDLIHLVQNLDNWPSLEKVSLIASIENAAGLGNEKASFSEIEKQFQKIRSLTGQLAYISLTHHTENRFGGGNYTSGIGLKEDGKRLLDLMDGLKIPVDLSHTSDELAGGILNHITQKGLEIPVIASHSNFRSIWSHPRNISDEFAKELIHREGLLGVNFLRAFLDNEVPERLYEHILHGFSIGGEKAICFGADFFYTRDFPDPKRFPFYFPLAENASKYPSILDHLNQRLTKEKLKGLAYQNSLNFYQKLWS